MSFWPSSGLWTLKYMRKEASVVIVAMSLVADSSSVDTVEAAASGDSEVRGISLRTTASTDDDWTENTRIPVMVPQDESAELIGDITTGSIAITDEGNEIDLTNAVGADAGSSSTDILKILRFISSTKAVFKINKLG